MPQKRAFLVGINNFSIEKYNLRGCVNDMNSLKSLLLTKFGFLDQDIQVLLDEQATNANIKSGLRALVKNAQKGDVLVFGVSSHGTQKPSVTGDEIDGMDEAIVPYDISYTSLIIDDELFGIVTNAIPPDGSVSFTAIYDLCHSGTLIKEMEMPWDTGTFPLVINRCIDMGLFTEVSSRGPIRDANLGPYNVFAACKDDETAADLSRVGEANVPRGAFSYALHHFITGKPDAKISELEGPVLEIIEKTSRHRQTPQWFAVDPNAKLFSVP